MILVIRAAFFAGIIVFALYIYFKYFKNGNNKEAKKDNENGISRDSKSDYSESDGNADAN